MSATLLLTSLLALSLATATEDATPAEQEPAATDAPPDAGAADAPPPIEPGPQGDAAPAPKKPPPPDAAGERNDLGLFVPVAQCCAGTVVAWLPIPCVTSAAAGYVVTAAGNGLSTRDNAALGPMVAGVITDVAVIGLIAAGYGVAFAGAASGSQAAALAGLIGGPLLIVGAFFARPFAVAAVTTATWQLQADQRGGEAWMPPPLFTPEEGEGGDGEKNHNDKKAPPAAGVAAR